MLLPRTDAAVGIEESALPLEQPALGRRRLCIRLDLVEAELTQLHDVEEGAEFRADLFLGDDGRPRLVRLAGVAGQHQSQRSWARQAAKRLQVCGYIFAAHHMIAATIKDKVERAGHTRFSSEDG